MDLKVKAWGCGLDSFGSGWGPMAGSCKCNKEPLDSIKGRCHELFKKDSVTWTGTTQNMFHGMGF
jgi:hypothetical protein